MKSLNAEWLGKNMHFFHKCSHKNSGVTSAQLSENKLLLSSYHHLLRGRLHMIKVTHQPKKQLSIVTFKMISVISCFTSYKPAEYLFSPQEDLAVMLLRAGLWKT